jgi:hypothetical protein
MFVGMYKPERMSITLPPTLAAPVGAAAFASLCWYVIVEKLRRHGKMAGIVIGALSGWSIFASGLLVAFMPAVITGSGFSNVEDFFYFVLMVLGSGPLFLFLAWGWVPVLLCILLGAFWAPNSCT